MNTPVTVTRESLIEAFEAWENGYRTDPTEFRTAEECNAMGVRQVSVERAEECNAMGVRQVSVERADYFMALLHELQGQDSNPREDETCL